MLVLLYPDCSEDGGVKQDTTALEHTGTHCGKPSEDGGVKQDTTAGQRQAASAIRVL